MIKNSKIVMSLIILVSGILMAQNTYLPDFQVNENAGYANNSSAQLVSLTENRFMGIWSDYRNGIAEKFYQIFDKNGAPIGENEFLTKNLFNDVCSASDGTFYGTWENSDGYIVVQRYDSLGNALGAEIQMSQQNYSAYRNPVIAINKAGAGVVVWVYSDWWSGDWKIYARCFNAQGTQGSQFEVVQDDLGRATPAVGIAGNGNLLIAWESEGEDVYYHMSIKGAWYGSNNQRIGNIFSINDPAGQGRQYSPDIAMHDDGYCVVAWQDGSNSGSSQEIMIQIYDSERQPVSRNIPATSGGNDPSQYSPKVVMDENKNITVIWNHYNSPWYDVYDDYVRLQRFDQNGNAVGSNIQISDYTTTSKKHRYSTIACSGENILCLWTDGRNNNDDIYGQVVDFSTGKVDGNYQVSLDFGCGIMNHPDVASDAEGNFVVVWEDNRNRTTDIYARLYNADGTPATDEFPLQYTDDHDEQEPRVDMNDNGLFVVSWWHEPESGDDPEIYARIFYANGSPRTSAFNVSQCGSSSFNDRDAYDHDIAISNSERVYAVWDTRPIYSVYGCWFNPYGYRSGVVVRMDETGGDYFQSKGGLTPSVDVDDNDNVVVTWENKSSSSSNVVYAKHLDRNNNVTKSAFAVCSSQSTDPRIAMHNSGFYAIVWEQSSGVYGQWFLADGEPIQNAVMIHKYHEERLLKSAPKEPDSSQAAIESEQLDPNAGLPVVAVGADSVFTVIWSNFEKEADPDLHYQLFDLNGNTLFEPALAHLDVPGTSQIHSAVTRTNSINIFAWSDNRVKNKGYNVFARIGEVAPQAGFTAMPPEGYLPLTVQFNNSTTGIATDYQWDFGDGNMSVDAHPVHVYDSVGVYTVKLIANGPGGADTLSRADYIIVSYEPPKADFNADSTLSQPPLTVQFEDRSTGDITSWLWDFGDGDTSHVQNPRHTYTYEDSFTVSLTVTGPGGTNTDTKDDYIIVFDLTGITETEPLVPTHFVLSQNYPNPFNPSTHMSFSVPEKSQVTVTVYDINGKSVDVLYHQIAEAGIHQLTWNASLLPAGTYIIKMVTGKHVESRKALLIK